MKKSNAFVISAALLSLVPNVTCIAGIVARIAKKKKAANTLDQVTKLISVPIALTSGIIAFWDWDEPELHKLQIATLWVSLNNVVTYVATDKFQSKEKLPDAAAQEEA